MNFRVVVDFVTKCEYRKMKQLKKGFIIDLCIQKLVAKIFFLLVLYQNSLILWLAGINCTNRLCKLDQQKI